MLKKILFAVAALCSMGTGQALAQSFPKPPDVPAYVQVTPLYKTDGTPNVEIDPTVTPPPYFATSGGPEPPTIPVPSLTNRVVTGSTGSSDFCTISSTCPQAKFRTHADFSHMLPDDPIRNYGQPGASHLHCFFGNGTTNAFSTYASLRKHAITSTAVGTDANGTGYWYPCVIKKNAFGDGKDYVVKADDIVVYYASDYPFLQKRTRIGRGVRYVFGYNMDDNDAWLQNILNAANAASSNHSRYHLHNTGSPQVWSINCSGANAPSTNNPAYLAAQSVKWFKNPDGSDPFGGTCPAGRQFWISVAGPDCWDGVNAWSPGGYKHVIPSIADQQDNKPVCPYNYYRIPAVQLEISLAQNGPSDYMTWELSSDAGKRTALGAPGDYVTYPPAFTFHTDWMFGWDNNIMQTWEEQCLGTDGVTPHQCAVSAISATQRLMGAYINSQCGVIRCPQVTDTAEGTTDPTKMLLIPPAWSGSWNGKMHH